MLDYPSGIAKQALRLARVPEDQMETMIEQGLTIAKIHPFPNAEVGYFWLVFPPQLLRIRSIPSNPGPHTEGRSGPGERQTPALPLTQDDEKNASDRLILSELYLGMQPPARWCAFLSKILISGTA